METTKVRRECQKEEMSCALGGSIALWKERWPLALVTPSQHQVAPPWVLTRRYFREVLMGDDYVLSVKNDYALTPLPSVTLWTVTG